MFGFHYLVSFIISAILVFNTTVCGNRINDCFVIIDKNISVYFPSIQSSNVILRETSFLDSDGKPKMAYHDTINNYIIRFTWNYTDVFDRYNQPKSKIDNILNDGRFFCKYVMTNKYYNKKLTTVLKEDYSEDKTQLILLIHDYECRQYEGESPMTRFEIINYVDRRSFFIEISKPVGTNTILDDVNWAKSFFNTYVDIDKSY